MNMVSVTYPIPGERGDARMPLILEQQQLYSVLSNNMEKNSFRFLSNLLQNSKAQYDLDRCWDTENTGN